MRSQKLTLLNHRLNTSQLQNMQQQSQTPSLFDKLLYVLFGLKLSLRLTLIFQFTFILLFAAASLAIGIHLFYLVPNISFTVYNYGQENGCVEKFGTGGFCEVTVHVRNKLEPPINIYYQLENYISNSKEYIGSKSNTQLYGGQIRLRSKEAQRCHPYITNRDMNVTKSWAGVDLDPNAVASPCGLQAKMLFRDEFQLWNSTHRLPMSQPISTRQFKKPPNSDSTQWLDPTSDRFSIWMTTSINKTVSKLYGILNQPLNIGNYTFKIKNNVDYSLFETKKNVKIMKLNNEFGNNVLLGLLFVGGGTCLMIISLLRFVYDIINLKR